MKFCDCTETDAVDVSSHCQYSTDWTEAGFKEDLTMSIFLRLKGVMWQPHSLDNFDDTGIVSDADHNGI